MRELANGVSRGGGGGGGGVGGSRRREAAGNGGRETAAAAAAVGGAGRTLAEVREQETGKAVAQSATPPMPW